MKKTNTGKKKSNAFTIINSNLEDQWTQQYTMCFCDSLCLTRLAHAGLSVSAPLTSYLSHWRKLRYSALSSLCISLCLPPCLCLSVYLHPSPKPLHTPPSMLHTVAKWLHFLDLRSQRESIVWLSAATLTHDLRSLIQSKGQCDYVMRETLWFICPEIFMGLQCVLCSLCWEQGS